MVKDYSKAKIYTIRNKNNSEDIYVGSTVKKYLCQRFGAHRANYKNPNIKCLLYEKMRETDINDWYIELYEAYPCNNKDELLKREGEIIRQIATLNKNVAGRTVKEWYEDNRDKVKQYYEENKEKILEQHKENYENNKQVKKDYYKQNRDVRLAYQKAYYHRKKQDSYV